MEGDLDEAVETARLDLRGIRVADAPEVARVLGDPALHTFTGGAPDRVEELRARWARWAKGSPEPGVTWLNRVVWLRAEGLAVGTVQATVLPAPAPLPGRASGAGFAPGHGEVAEVAWVVGTAWQGRGIAREAARGWVAWLRARGVGEVRAFIHPGHGTSAAVARSAGLRPTAESRDGEVCWSTRGSSG